MSVSFEGDYERFLPRGVAGRGSQVSDVVWPRAEELLQGGWAYDRKARPEQLLLGYREVAGENKPIGISDNRHVLICAGSRAGKTVSYLAPNLLLYDGSALVLDPKGELASLTAKQRLAKGQEVYIVDPFGVSGAAEKPHLKRCAASYNPLLDIDIKSPRAIDDAAVLADAIIQIPAKGEKHWAESAQIILQALILTVVGTVAEAGRHFGTVRAMLTGTDPYIKEWGEKEGIAPENALWVYLKSLARGRGTDWQFVVAGVGAWMMEIGEKERGSIISTARTQTRFLDSPDLVRTMASSSFRLSELKTGKNPMMGVGKPVTVYLCLPASMMASHGRWMRLMISLAVIAFERTKAQVKLPVLFVLEELATTIGYSRQLESAAGLIAGYGVKLISVIQDLGQLKNHYEKGWETFIGNAGVSIFFGNSDMTTLEYISRRVGQSSFMISQPSGASPGALLQGARSTTEQLRTEPLWTTMEAEQALGRTTRGALIVPAGLPPFYVKRVDYREPPLDKLWDQTYQPSG